MHEWQNEELEQTFDDIDFCSMHRKKYCSGAFNRSSTNRTWTNYFGWMRDYSCPSMACPQQFHAEVVTEWLMAHGYCNYTKYGKGDHAARRALSSSFLLLVI
jgi:hypothetical protein